MAWRMGWSRLSTEVGGEVYTPEGCAAIQRDLGRLEKRANRNHRKFSKRKGKFLHPGSVMAVSGRVWAGEGCWGDGCGKRLWTTLCLPQPVPKGSGTTCTRTSGSQRSPQGLSADDLGNGQLRGWSGAEGHMHTPLRDCGHGPPVAGQGHP